MTRPLINDEYTQDEDARRDAVDERRARARQRCQCGDDMPGRCPGPDACPLCQEDE